jgi:molecular chaperone DnaK (HSP70)
MTDIIIGIDLGTSNSCVSVYHNNEIKVINNLSGNKTTPSYVYINKDEIIIGEVAKDLIYKEPNKVIYDSKRLIGQNYQQNNFLTYNVINKNNNSIIKIDDKEYSPEEISSFILKYMKNIAENFMGETIHKAIITVPAYFKDSQRQATIKAAEFAGLEVVRLLNEPSSAAIAYGLDLKKDNYKILVFDLGGGTLDVSILELNNNIFDILAVSGNTKFGGEDFDNKIMAHIYKEFINKNKISQKDSLNILNNNKLKAKIKYQAERAKKELSINNTTNINIESFYNDIDLNVNLSRLLFEKICENEFKQILLPIEEALQSAKLNKNDINDIILIGGTTRIPKVKNILEDFFNKKVLDNIDPDTTVSIGAAILGHSLINKNSNSIICMDVTPLSLGIEVNGNLMSVIIPRNTKIPITKTHTFTTSSDYQTCVNIKIYEGERAFVKDNLFLGSFDLIGIKPEKRGIPKIKVSFKIDNNSILSVYSCEENSKIENQLIINTNNQDKISKILDIENRQNKESDEKQKLFMEKYNKIKIKLYSLKNKLETPDIKLNMDENKYHNLFCKILEYIKLLNNNKINENNIDIIINDINNINMF